MGRTGLAATPSLRGEVSEAWSWTVPPEPGGEIAEEPRVWHDEVFVSVRVDSQRAALWALDLTTGGALLPPLVFESTHLLDPCVTEAGVLVRPGADSLQLVRPAAGRWVKLWDSGVPGDRVASHLAHDGRVHALTTSGIVTWHLPSTDPVWQHEGRFRGTLAVQDASLLVLSYDEAGNAELGWWDTVRGSPRSSQRVGHHGSSAPPDTTWSSRIVASGAEVFVQHATPVRAADGDPMRTSHLLPGRDSGLYDLDALPVATGKGWLIYGSDERTPALRLCEESREGGGLRWVDLAKRDERPAFHLPELPLTVTGGTAWVAGRAFDLASRRVVCALPQVQMRFRPVPAEGHLLAVPDASRLTAWRSAATPPDGPFGLGALQSAEGAGPPAALTGVDGRILFGDATVYSGVFDVDALAGTLTLRPAKAKPVTRPLRAAQVVLQGAERLLYVASLTWLERRLLRCARLAAKETVLAALKPAVAARHADLIVEVIQEALQRGASDKELATARREEQKLRANPLKPYEPKVIETRARLAEASGLTPAQLLSVLASGLADPRPAVRSPLLRRVLALEPSHPEATALVRAALPTHVVVPEPFVARDWIDAREVLSGIPTKNVDPPPEGARALTPGERELGAARAYWRPDLVGVESEQLLIITPLKSPDRLAYCLALGELVCTALEDMFAKGVHLRKNRWPLILQLFETEEEYRKHKVGGGEPEETRVWSAGHYDPQAGLSRIYVPAGDEALESVRRTYAHELTHHWIQERCPLFEARLATSTGRDVTWIVEGMAELVESFEWNLATRSWVTFVPASRLLDEGAHGIRWESWSAFFDVTDSQFERLDRTLRHTVVLQSELGTTIKTSDLHAFYALSGTVCQYLFHAGPTQRAALLTYVASAYTGKVQSGTDHIQRHFGMSPEDLGAAALAWARRVVRGELHAKDVYLR